MQSHTTDTDEDSKLKLVRSALKFAAQRFQALPRFTDPQLRQLSAVMECRKFDGGSEIIRQGATDDSYYVLASGECAVQIDGQTVGKISAGGGFGEVALSLDTPRTATIIATTACTTYQLRRGKYQQVMEQLRGDAAREAASSPKADWRQRLRDQQARSVASEHDDSTGDNRSGGHLVRSDSPRTRRSGSSSAGSLDSDRTSGRTRSHTQKKNGDQQLGGRRSSSRRHSSEVPRSSRSSARPSRRRTAGTSSDRSRFDGDEDGGASVDSDTSSLSMSSVSSCYDSADEPQRSTAHAALERKIRHALHEERQLRRQLEVSTAGTWRPTVHGRYILWYLRTEPGLFCSVESFRSKRPLTSG
jgi:CRP-like cAMP-binding protein